VCTARCSYSSTCLLTTCDASCATAEGVLLQASTPPTPAAAAATIAAPVATAVVLREPAPPAHTHPASASASGGRKGNAKLRRPATAGDATSGSTTLVQPRLQFLTRAESASVDRPLHRPTVLSAHAKKYGRSWFTKPETWRNGGIAADGSEQAVVPGSLQGALTVLINCTPLLQSVHNKVPLCADVHTVSG
jgi:hypothetical protein